jgi:hypothetical protein
MLPLAQAKAPSNVLRVAVGCGKDGEKSTMMLRSLTGLPSFNTLFHQATRCVLGWDGDKQ